MAESQGRLLMGQWNPSSTLDSSTERASVPMSPVLLSSRGHLLLETNDKKGGMG